MAFPQILDPNAPAGTDSPRLGDDQIRALKLFLADLFTLPTSPSQISAACGSVSTGGKLSLTNAAWTADVIAASYGGTGLSSYTIGDLLHASGATALARLASVATGNALISGGVGTQSTWGKIGLTTHISGNLPVSHLNSGTGASSSTYWRGDATWSSPVGVANTWLGVQTFDTNAIFKGPSPWIDVKAYGAVGDGVTDDTTAFLNAIAAVQQTSTVEGGTVYVPPGRYKISSSLTIGGTAANSVRLIGAGVLASTLYYTGTTTPAIIYSGVGTGGFAAGGAGNTAGTGRGNHVEIAHLHVYSTSLTGTTPLVRITTGAHYGHLHHLLLDCGTNNSPVGLEILAGNTIRLSAIDIWRPSTYGVHFNGTGSDIFFNQVMVWMEGATGAGTAAVKSTTFIGGGVSFTDCQFFYGLVSVDLTSTHFTFFLNCYFDSWGPSGGTTGIGAKLTLCNLVHFTNCWFAGNGNGVDIVSGYGTALVNCVLYQCQLNGVRIRSGTADAKVQNCNILGNNVSNNADGHGILVDAGTGDFILTGNVSQNDFSGHQKYGIKVAAGSSDFYVISQNVCRSTSTMFVTGNETGGVLDSGTGVNKSVTGNITA